MTEEEVDIYSINVIKGILIGALDSKSSLVIIELMKKCSMNKAGLNILEQYLNSLKSSKSFTYEHSVKVAWISYVMARWNNKSYKESILLSTLGLLHDIGKIGMPESLLNKNGKLTLKEYELIKMHPEYSSKWLNAADCFSDKIIDIVASHHEKINGTGYPLGKEKKEINSMTKMLSIADIFEALTANRPYKSALTSNEALEIMDEMVKSEEIDVEIFKVFKNNIKNIVEKDKVNKGMTYKNVDVQIIGYDEKLGAPVVKIIGASIS